MKDTDRKEAGRLLKRDKILLGITIGVAALDAGLAYGTYLKKKGGFWHMCESPIASL